MKIKCLFTLVMYVLLNGCTNFLDPDEKPDYSKRIIIKKVEYNSKISIEWYHYSLITGFSPGHIDIVSENTNEPICESSYISDFRLSNDTLTVVLWKNHTNTIKFENKADIVIRVDTTGSHPPYF